MLSRLTDRSDVEHEVRHLTGSFWGWRRGGGGFESLQLPKRFVLICRVVVQQNKGHAVSADGLSAVLLVKQGTNSARHVKPVNLNSTYIYEILSYRYFSFCLTNSNYLDCLWWSLSKPAVHRAVLRIVNAGF